MLAVMVELLSGRYVATAYNDRDAVEWPPHPARLFSALVATWAAAEPGSEPGERELAALTWLERQPAPEVLACDVDAAGIRDVLPVFVPVNDTFTVSAPASAKLDEALAELSGASDERTASRARRKVEQEQKKLVSATQKAIAVPGKALKDASIAEKLVIAERRAKQPRTFPCATPAETTIGFVWSQAQPPAELVPALERLLTRLVRLGHSSSFVRAAMGDAHAVSALQARVARYVPDPERGELVLRWVTANQVENLCRAFKLHEETEPRVLPSSFVRYSVDGLVSRAGVTCSVFDDDIIVLSRVGGPRLPIVATAGLSRQVRRALMSVVEEPISEMLSGHALDGSPSDSPHLAVVPLPFAGSRYADGSIQGVALVLPRSCDAERRRAVARAVGLLERRSSTEGRREEAPVIAIRLAGTGALQLQRVTWGESNKASLRVRSWCRPSRVWGSVTPVALDRNPGNLHDDSPERRRKAFEEAQATVRSAVSRVVFRSGDDAAVEPEQVDVLRSCVVAGTAKPRAYPRFPHDTSRPQRVLVHVRLVFSESVRGPLLLGAGRYQGLGLCLPLDPLAGGREGSS